jgi:hypothetical protein
VIRATVVFVLLAVAVAFASIPEGDGPHIPPDVLGFADWDCNNPAPHSFVSSRLIILDPVLATVIAAHELDHEDYILSVAETCPEWKQIQTVAMRLDMEVRAYCTAAIMAQQLGRFYTVEQGIWFFSDWLRHYPVAGGMTRQDVFDLIMDRCAAHVGS